MKAIQRTVKPSTYTGKDYNKWIKYIIKLNDKITGKHLLDRLAK